MFPSPSRAVAISGSVAVNVIDDDARGLCAQYRRHSVSDGGLYLDAENTTSVGSLAGAVAFGKASKGKTSRGIAGAFGVNVLTGDTKAFVDESDTASCWTGWISKRPAAAGRFPSRPVSASPRGGRRSPSAARWGSISPSTRWKHSSQNTTGIVNGAVRLNAEDDTNLIAIAGAGGFGSKAGVGIGFGFSYTGNTVRAKLWTCEFLKHTGDLDVLATADGLIVSVTGSIGVATGSKCCGGGYAGAGTDLGELRPQHHRGQYPQQHHDHRLDRRYHAVRPGQDVRLLVCRRPRVWQELWASGPPSQ